MDTSDTNRPRRALMFDLAELELEPVTIRTPDAYGLSFSERTGFEVLPYDRHGRPIHHRPLGERTYETPSEAYAAIRAFERERAAA